MLPMIHSAFFQDKIEPVKFPIDKMLVIEEMITMAFNESSINFDNDKNA
jgi:hypothetical protein